MRNLTKLHRSTTEIFHAERQMKWQENTFIHICKMHPRSVEIWNYELLLFDILHIFEKCHYLDTFNVVLVIDLIEISIVWILKQWLHVIKVIAFLTNQLETGTETNLQSWIVVIIRRQLFPLSVLSKFFTFSQ